VLYGAAAIALAFAAYGGIQAVQARSSLKESQERLVAHIGLTPTVSKRLAPGYVDADGGLVADPPADAAKLIDPEEIVVAHYEGDDDEERVNWQAFQEQLSQATGRKVVHQRYVNGADEVSAIKAGKIHVVALHSADVPYIVNNAGFVPLAVLGSRAGASGNHLVIAAGASSKIQSLPDVRGADVAFTTPGSITGYRAAVAVLAQDAGLRSGIDYRFHFSLGQKRSIRGILDEKHEVAALSADKIESMLADGSLKETDYRVIYESPVIPRLTIGHVHNLNAQLAAQLTKCIFDFDNAAAADEAGGASQDEGGGDDAAAKAGGERMRFLPIDYQKDFSFVRRIDDSFDPRFGIAPELSP
jgi:phosphonate transport system substrate-binding protein